MDFIKSKNVGRLLTGELSHQILVLFVHEPHYQVILVVSVEMNDEYLKQKKDVYINYIDTEALHLIN